MIDKAIQNNSRGFFGVFVGKKIQIKYMITTNEDFVEGLLVKMRGFWGK